MEGTDALVTREFQATDNTTAISDHEFGTLATLKTFTISPIVSIPTEYFTPTATESSDQLFGTPNDDDYNGLGGNDIFYGSFGADHLDGGDGFDTVSYEYAGARVYSDLTFGGWGDDAEGDTYANIENLRGGNVDDTLRGDDANNEIVGLAGDDVIDGRDGQDRLYGDDGNDTLRGGSGHDDLFGGKGDDLMSGGEGADTFHLDLRGNGRDTITDFQHGVDTISTYVRHFPHEPTEENLFGRDFTLAHGSLVDVPFFGERLSHDNFDSSDWLFFNDETHQLIALDMNHSNLTDRVTHGQVLATFGSDVTLTAADFI